MTRLLPLLIVVLLVGCDTTHGTFEGYAVEITYPESPMGRSICVYSKTKDGGSVQAWGSRSEYFNEIRAYNLKPDDPVLKFMDMNLLTQVYKEVDVSATKKDAP